VSRMSMNMRRSLAHNGPTIRDHELILKRSLCKFFYE
jgi:hypothetical protein